MWPSEAAPEAGVFVRDQVEALRRQGGLEVEVARFPRGSRSYPVAAWRLRRAGRRFDVVHAHYGLSGWSALAARAPRLVVTFHGTDLRHPVVGPLSRALVRFVTLPAAASATLARRRLAAVSARRAIAVLPCGLDAARFHPVPRAEARRRLGLDRDRPHLLFPADPARPVKRHDRALALARRFPGARLLALRNVAPDEVPLWVNAANAVLVTSEEEGFGLAALEALACDVPVLSTPVGVAPLALGGVPGALCAPWDEERWAQALAALVDDADPRVEGRARALLFSSDRLAGRVAAAYRALDTAQG
jgi:glycosyltransferase involved in cell wall biosynthesis